MLAPEVINLLPPKSENFLIENDNEKIVNALRQQYFNHSVSQAWPKSQVVMLEQPPALITGWSVDELQQALVTEPLCW